MVMGLLAWPALPPLLALLLLLEELPQAVTTSTADSARATTATLRRIFMTPCPSARTPWVRRLDPPDCCNRLQLDHSGGWHECQLQSCAAKSFPNTDHSIELDVSRVFQG